jgi:AcrR family transcriptional regulator
MKGRVPQPSQIPASNDGASNTPERCTGLQTVAKTTVVKQSRSSETRHRIIAAARELFLAKGFDGTSVAEICRLAGVSNGALFHQFPTKEDLGFAVYTLVRRDFWGRVMAAMTEPDDPLDGVEAAVRAAFAFQRDDPGGAAFMFDVSGSKWIEDFADQSQVVHDIVSSRGLAWAEPHIAAGRLPPVPADVFVALASGAPQWMGRMCRIGMNAAPFDTIAEQMPIYVRRAFTPQ